GRDLRQPAPAEAAVVHADGAGRTAVAEVSAPKNAVFVPFSAQTRMSGCDLDGRVIRKGAADAIARHVAAQGGALPREVDAAAAEIAKSGGTPLVVSEGRRGVGGGAPKVIVEGGRQRWCARLRHLGPRTDS